MATSRQRLPKSTPFFYGWVIVAVAALSNIARVSTAVEVLSIFVPYLIRDYGWSRTLISSAVTVGSLGGGFLAIIFGRIVDRYGPRVVTGLGSLAVGLGCVILALLQGPAMFIGGYGMARATGHGMVMVAAPVAVANWFIRSRGKAMAIMFTTSYVGIIIAPPIVQAIINAYDWRAGWVALAALAFALGVIPPFFFLVRRPEDVGMTPDGVPSAKDQGMTARKTLLKEPAADWTLKQTLADPSVWFIMAATFFSGIMVAGVGLHQVPYYLERGISPTLAASIVSVYAIGLAVGSFFLGWLADRVSTRGLILASYVVGTVSMAYLLFVNDPLTAFSFAFMFGVLVGGFFTLIPIMLASYYGRLNLGSIMGMVQMSKTSGLAIGPLVAGAFFDITESYEAAFVTFGVLSLLSAAFMSFARRPQAKTEVLETRR